MDEIERIRNLDDELFDELKLYFPKIKQSNFAKKFPNTNLTIQLYNTSSNFIKNSIFDICELDDYYGMKILFRSLTEHFLRFKYVFVKFGLEKNDDFAKIYLECGDAREILDAIKANVSEQQLYDQNFKIEDWDKFLDGHPNFKTMSRKQVEEETNRYTFKNIIRFLNTHYKAGGLDVTGLLGKMIIEYSNLSSYVHGGLKSFHEMTSTTDESRAKDYVRFCGLAFQIAGTIKLFSLLLYYQTDQELFNEHYLKIESILKRLNHKETC